jgi:hypothetical protein
MAPDCLQAVRQPIRIHGDPSARLLLTQNRVILTNISCRQFVASDGVISSVDPWAKSPIGVQLILPTRFWVYYALQWVNLYAACLRVNLYAAHLWWNSFAARFRVYYALQWVDPYAARSRVNLYAARSWVNSFAARIVPWTHMLPVCG